ncbi:Response Regulator Receiver Signal Transduction Histidine Kinase [Planktothrix serta PCC 8927]|uniref:histidine kinase n=1 Tax=Planktothrix serta PCC 8927 TaxID=671068 RepID=A0A7Z9BUW3_9CYAN|nr:response regulator [Planktothrix serta]VXD21873.1 Response Regulator Receiver Signal Transduction Histidine Kinase [Planktothrix serta PCC 8927]
MNHSSNNQPKADLLVVDDTPANLRFLSQMLVNQGYNVRKAINGQMALTAVKTILPDLILLDINLPGMNGYQVCEQLKQDERTRNIPIIFLSALDDILDKVKAFQAGGVDYITKPFQFEEVLIRIQNQLTIQQLQSQLKQQNSQLQLTVNELKLTQAQLIQKEKMVSLGQLVAGIAHEINNPISFISGNLAPAQQYIQDLLNLISLYQKEYPLPSPSIQAFLQELELDFISNDLQNILGSMERGTERIRTIILALRIFSRLGESDIKPVDLHQGLDSTLLLLQYRLRSEGQRSEIEIIKSYDNLPPVTCYASQINQVFLNLLTNSIDALESGIGSKILPGMSPTIWIITEATHPNEIRIRIKDNGVGMSEEVKSQLFNPFFTTKPVGHGMGLGLTTCYEIIVQKHQGKLSCNSDEGEGCEFIIDLPTQMNS